MTMKQIMAELKSSKANLEHFKKLNEEMVKERGWAGFEKEVAYYTKQIEKYEAMIPEARKAEEEKLLKKIAKEQLKGKASSIGFIENGSSIHGVTPEGKRWSAEHNHYGCTERTRHCFTLWIEGKGMIFTSGTLDSVLMTVAQN